MALCLCHDIKLGAVKRDAEIADLVARAARLPRNSHVPVGAGDVWAALFTGDEGGGR